MLRGAPRSSPRTGALNGGPPGGGFSRAGGWTMLQVARTASLVVALLLFASVGPVSAQCAWVLWSGHIGPAVGSKGLYIRREIYSRRDQCVEVMTDSKRPRSLRATGRSAGIARHSFRCLGRERGSEHQCSASPTRCGRKTSSADVVAAEALPQLDHRAGATPPERVQDAEVALPR
jgi:hypothetical protein